MTVTHHIRTEEEEEQQEACLPSPPCPFCECDVVVQRQQLFSLAGRRGRKGRCSAGAVCSCMSWVRAGLCVLCFLQLPPELC